MLEIAALGLLQREPLHGYRLKQLLELFMSGCISVNYGSIYPMLKRLEERGAISVLVDHDGAGGSTRKIYSITALGKEMWKQEMMIHPHESWVNARSRFMIKFFFFNHLESVERIKLLENRLMVCRLRLENHERETLARDSYQVAAWQKYLEELGQDIEWLKEQLKLEEKKASLEKNSC